jgi:hypothetical protein
VRLLDHLPHFSKNRSQPRWIESIEDLDHVDVLLSRLIKV